MADAASVAVGNEGVPITDMSRRGILALLAATPIVVAIGKDLPSPSIGSAFSTSFDHAGKLIRGVERRFNAPMLSPGAQLRMPKGIRAVPIEGFFKNRPRVGQAAYSWPYLPAESGRIIDASIAPARGAASHMAVLSGFQQGWYELVHASGKVERVEWDVERLPFLWVWGEFGAFKDLPFNGRFYTIGVVPFSRPPVS